MKVSFLSKLSTISSRVPNNKETTKYSYDGTRPRLKYIPVSLDSTKGAVAFEHAAISNMISGLSTRNIEESACEAVLIESVSNPSTLISMVVQRSNFRL